MRTLNNRYLRRKIQDQTISETKNGVVMSVDSTNRYCMVRVGGSTNEIRANYPLSWNYTPYWVKKAAPVIIRQMKGLKYRFEIQEIGQIIPSDVSGNTLPDITLDDNRIISGCDITEIPNEPQMMVMIRTGQYRIGSTYYTLDGIACDSSDYKINMGGKMDKTAGVLNIDSASTGDFRTDIIVVGDDNILDVVKGTTYTSTEVVPDTPASHLYLGKVVIYPNMTEVKNYDIDRKFMIPDPKSLDIVVDDDDLAWAETETTITITVKDQYDNSLSKDGYGWYVKLEINDGNGAIASTEEGSSTSIIGVHCGTAASCKFTYTRDQASTDISPLLKITLESEFPVETYTYIILRDSSGDIMTS